MKLFSWLFGWMRKKKMPILPMHRDNRIEVVTQLKDHSDDLKDILMRAGREILNEQRLKMAERRQQVRNDPELPTYFKNIVSYLQSQSVDQGSHGVVSLGYNDVECEKDDYEIIFSFFIMACQEAGLQLNIVRSGAYYHVKDCDNIRAAIEKISQSMDNETRLQLTQGAYR